MTDIIETQQQQQQQKEIPTVAIESEMISDQKNISPAKSLTDSFNGHGSPKLPRKSTISVGNHKRSPTQTISFSSSSSSPSSSPTTGGYFSKSSPNLEHYRKANDLPIIQKTDHSINPLIPDLNVLNGSNGSINDDSICYLKLQLSTTTTTTTTREDSDSEEDNNRLLVENNNNKNRHNIITPPPSPTTSPKYSPIPLVITPSSPGTSNPDELNMNLVQLLACFPDPPTVIPLHFSGAKRRDTVFAMVSQPLLTGSSNSLLNSLNTSNNNLSILLNNSSTVSLGSKDLDGASILKDSSNSSFSSNSEADNFISDTTQSSPSINLTPITITEPSININNDNNENIVTLSGNDSPIENQQEVKVDEKEEQPEKVEKEEESIKVDQEEILEVKEEKEAIVNEEKESNIITTSTTTTTTTTTITEKNIESQSNSTPLSTPTKELNISISPDSRASLSIPKFVPPPSPNSAYTPPTRSSNYSSICITSSPHGRTYSVSQKPLSPNSQTATPPLWEVNLNQLTTEVREFNDLSASSNSPNYELLLKGCRNELNTQDQNRLIVRLLEINTADSIKMLDRANEALNNQATAQTAKKSLFSAMKSAVKETRFLKLSKVIMYFGIANLPIQINQVVTDEITLTCFSSKAKYKVSLGPPSSTHTLTCSQNATGKLKKKDSLTIGFKLILKATVRLRRLITIDIENGGRHYVLIQVESSKTAFGESLDTTEMTEDNSFTVPLALVNLKSALISMGGLDEVHIFRIAPSSNERELIAVKEMVNKQPIKCSDVNIISTLIKAWFRELSQPLLYMIPVQNFLNYATQQDGISMLNSLQSSPTQANIFLWLIDLLSLISSNANKNKMTIKSLAVVFAPNLYIPPNTLTPQESLLASNKIVSFIEDCIILMKNKQLFQLNNLF
ncbi:RhoGAP domain-containing protein [Heterostelium album PN500]|uniref:RhoGAP domain-containing protein n=1 Tax=Heterostelium pallidum (strain ATCC 26659 / Pp 5 / PN500) TaxID=670386 RepID=D3B623_HETP5|nr:RhoGAP domain-containing protein [Heterostelium album PN500]EFA83321.1 RhoGAP domain-containing protein [Heterostelium album PN500]|eukprot:XP_020435438.1 RhoGAP domain-containing protein [Heterostelium album PN500]